MNRPPALSAASGRSAGNRCSAAGRRQSSSTTTIPANDTAFSANTSVGPDRDTSAPAMAGPIALAPFMLMLPSAAAAGICSRGTRSGWIACQAGAVSACPQPIRKSRVNSTVGVARPAPVRVASAATPAAIAPWVASNNRRRSTRSASTPEGSASSITGSVVAVWTSGTRTGARGSPTSIHCAPTVCIHVPRLETNWAIHSAR